MYQINEFDQNFALLRDKFQELFAQDETELCLTIARVLEDMRIVGFDDTNINDANARMLEAFVGTDNCLRVVSGCAYIGMITVLESIRKEQNADA